MDEWKDIPDFPDYEVSKDGKVRNKKSKKILKHYLGVRGYYVVNLRKDAKPSTIYVHRLLAQAFIPNPSNKRFVDHKDRDRKNNTLSNLRWVNSIENAQNSERVINNSSGEIYIHQYFKVHIDNEVVKFQGYYQTLQEAIKARDEVLSGCDLTSLDSSS